MVEYSIKFTVAWFTELEPEAQVFVATLFTGFVTALGAALFSFLTPGSETSTGAYLIKIIHLPHKKTGDFTQFAANSAAHFPSPSLPNPGLRGFRPP